MENIIKQTPSYSLQVGKSVESGNNCYQIINIKYNVIELETYMLPQALRYLEDIQAGLDAVSDPEYFKAKTEPKQTVTPFKGK